MIGSDRVAVCDRENFRVQVFTTEGEYVDQWHLHHPACITQGRGADTTSTLARWGRRRFKISYLIWATG